MHRIKFVCTLLVAVALLLSGLTAYATTAEASAPWTPDQCDMSVTTFEWNKAPADGQEVYAPDGRNFVGKVGCVEPDYGIAIVLTGGGTTDVLAVCPAVICNSFASASQLIDPYEHRSSRTLTAYAGPVHRLQAGQLTAATVRQFGDSRTFITYNAG